MRLRASDSSASNRSERMFGTNNATASNYITSTLRADRPPEGTFALFTPQRANVTETSGVMSASDVALDHAHASPLRYLRRRAERNAASKTEIGRASCRERVKITVVAV